MALVWFGVGVACGGLPREACSETYFSGGSLEPEIAEFDDLWRQIYSRCLRTMAEPTLRGGEPGSPVRVRLLYLRSFDPPVCVRVTGGEGGARIVTAVTAGRDVAPDEPVTRGGTTISRERWVAIRRRLDDPAVWMPRGSTEVEKWTFDGARWLLEMSDGAVHRVVHRHSPEAGGPHHAFRSLCVDLMVAGELGLPSSEIY